MANLLLKLGAYVLPPTFYVEKWPSLRAVPTAQLPRADGARVIAGYLEGKTWTIKGGMVGGGETLPTAQTFLRAQLDALRAACNAGQTTFQTHDDRYFRNCQITQFEERYLDTGFGRLVEITFDVVTGDPFAYELATNTVSLPAPSGTAFDLVCTVGGNTLALPLVQIQPASGPFALTLTNGATGDVCTLRLGATLPGETITLRIDSQSQTVIRNEDGADRIALFDGRFPRLAVGSNTLHFAFSGSVNTAVVTWQNRWR